MCGICGVVSKEPLKPYTGRVVKLLEDLQGRGRDAWGFFATNLDNSQIAPNMTEQLWKNAYTPKEVFGSKQGSLDLSQTGVFLAHTRASTQGSEKENKNNHPFISEDFVFAHNGGVGNHKEHKERLGLTYDSECDSPVILFAIQKRYDELKKEKGIHDPVLEAIERGLEDVSDANLACWLIHRQSKRVFLFRNKIYPLHVVKMKAGHMIFASEKVNLTKSWGVEWSHIRELEPETIYEVLEQDDGDLDAERVGSWKSTSRGYSKIDYRPNRSQSQKVDVNTTRRVRQRDGSVVKYDITSLSQRLGFLGEKFELDMQFSFRNDDTFVISTRQEKAMDIVSACDNWNDAVSHLQYDGVPFIIVHVEADKIGQFLDDIEESIYRQGIATPPAGFGFIRWLRNLEGVEIIEQTGTFLKARATTGFSTRILKEIGLATNSDGEFTIKRKNSEKFQSTLKKFEKKIPLHTKQS